MPTKPELVKRAAEILAAMPPDQRKNAAKLGFVALELRKRGPSFECVSEEITPAILAEESRLRQRVGDELNAKRATAGL